MIVTPTSIANIPRILVQLRNRTVQRVHRQMHACPAIVTMTYLRVPPKKLLVPLARAGTHASRIFVMGMSVR